MNRRLLAVGALFALVALSGCLGGGGEISEDDLTKDAEYDWDKNVTASYNVTTSPLLSFSADEYKAVVTVENRTTAEIHRGTLLRGDQSVSIEALQFQYPNGTIVNATHDNLTAVEQSDETEIRFPVENGTIAYRANWASGSFGGSPRTWRVQTPVDGSHEVLMPDGSRTDLPLFSLTSPGGHSTGVENNRARIRWDSLNSGGITVRYYLIRDLYIFGGVFVLAGFAGAVGVLYYYRGIRRAKKKRKEVGLDVEQDDDDDIGDDGPPPGVR
ncbi:MAG: hypothetical protein J07HX64_01781 [halophilic archaeon J07HX64]|jgi:hypothetical protein|nr:MAG: hypothetical protein J07HX64_01781 [halophilic archaeon J07HX64]